MSKYQEALDNITPIDDEGWGCDIGEDIDTLQECINKLARYEALEQELGIDLVKLFNDKNSYFIELNILIQPNMVRPGG